MSTVLEITEQVLKEHNVPYKVTSECEWPDTNKIHVTSVIMINPSDLTSYKIDIIIEIKKHSIKFDGWEFPSKTCKHSLATLYFYSDTHYYDIDFVDCEDISKGCKCECDSCKDLSDEVQIILYK